MDMRGELQLFDEFFRQAPARIDVEGIRQAWLALRPPFRVDDRVLPLPLWAQRQYTETGEEAWQTLRRDLGRIQANKSLCIYLHIPFCDSKCGFCDSYSFKLAQKHWANQVDEYVAMLQQEMRLWSKQGSLNQRPVTTVHFGGGTPSFLGETAFKRLVKSCAEYFYTSPQTEWALESTISHLSPEMLSLLDYLGFNRLHIGVQSLEDPVRQLIGRRQPALKALKKIAEIIDMGWVVTVDLICGLPGQTLSGFVSGIEALLELGIPGFSLYELLIFPQNQKWAERHGLVEGGHLSNYFLFQVGANLLDLAGFKKNIFNHFANETDKNLYFTFPERGEDLLALGTIADGVFGDYHYRHPIYKPYRHSVSQTFPALEGGLRRNKFENYLHPITTALLSGQIPAALRPYLEVAIPNSGEVLVQHWFDTALLLDNSDNGGLDLTANGSWFTGNMISQLANCWQSCHKSQIMSN